MRASQKLSESQAKGVSARDRDMFVEIDIDGFENGIDVS
jgi:hypothetical protein